MAKSEKIVTLKSNKSVLGNYLQSEEDALKIVVTDGTTELARSFLYRMLNDNVFGENQSVFISLYELPRKAIFLESVAIELTSFSPKLLSGKHPYTVTFLIGISYGHDASVEFKNADVVICIGYAREYDFKDNEYLEPFFEEHVLNSKFYGEVIERYVKRNAKIIVLGNTAATIISKYVKSIPIRNITTLSLLNLNIVAGQVPLRIQCMLSLILSSRYIAARIQCLPTEVKNIIIWGSNGSHSFPDCRYIRLTSGKPLPDALKVWISNVLPCTIQNVACRSSLVNSIAYGLAEHCKIMWNGTPEDEWTSMGVLSDYSYSIRSGIFFSFPVICRNRQYEIVKNFDMDRYIQRYIVGLSKLIFKEIEIACDICGLKATDQ
ncbi:malate dehydrogenase-like [Frieseomelitta varia]|uniref:malate dehydrogenase-like n=1 Tax=Frieseomelitta varia TaxID=561572 RepID=UPI001CB68DF7|nr:malate dehydrogenase-like [Frieseomelitta varia]